MEQQMLIDGKRYDLVKEQRSGLAVYTDGDTYLRLGEPERIERNIATHRAMEAAGFPVAPLLKSGSYKEYAYFSEVSLGPKTFRILFEEDIVKQGAVSAERFDAFTDVVERYLLAQSRAVIVPDPVGFANGIHLEIIREELPQYRFSLPDKFDRILQKLVTFPYVLSHGDFNPANLFPAGVIDLEDSFPAPFGFDAVSAISTNEWFPTSSEYEFYSHYRFSDAQKTHYLAMCDRVSQAAGYPCISAHYDDFAFCRAVWSAVRMHAWPRLQAWRYEKFVKTFLFY